MCVLRCVVRASVEWGRGGLRGRESEPNPRVGSCRLATHAKGVPLVNPVYQSVLSK